MNERKEIFEGKKSETYSIIKIVDVGDNSKDRMEIDSITGTLDDVKKQVSKNNKIVKIDKSKKEIIVERKVLEAAGDNIGAISAMDTFKVGKTMTFLKDVVYASLEELFEYLECNPNVSDALKIFTLKAKPTIVKGEVVYTIPKGTKFTIKSFFPGKGDVIIDVWGVDIPMEYIPYKNKGIDWDDPEIGEWVK